MCQFPQVFALLGLENRRTMFAPGRLPYGTNMTFRPELLVADRFDPEFGVGGLPPVMGEDIVLLDSGRVVSLIWSLYYIPRRRMMQGS